MHKLYAVSHHLSREMQGVAGVEKLVVLSSALNDGRKMKNSRKKS
jgi:hypothetical protein